MKTIEQSLEILKLDLISKYNFIDFKMVPSISHLNIVIQLKMNDSKFLNNFLFISKVFFLWFNRKLLIINFFKENLEQRNKNSLIMNLNLLIRDKNIIFKNLFYLINIVKLLSNRTDYGFKFKNNFFYLNYFFFNINYLLGLEIGKFFN